MFFDFISLELLVNAIDLLDFVYAVDVADTFNAFADEGICPRDCD